MFLIDPKKLTVMVLTATAIFVSTAARAAVCVVPGVADPTAALGLGYCASYESGNTVTGTIGANDNYIDVVVDPGTPSGTYDPESYVSWDILVEWDSVANLGTLTTAFPDITEEKYEADENLEWPTGIQTQPSDPTQGNITVWCDPPGKEAGSFAATCNVVDATHASYVNGFAGTSKSLIIRDAYVVMRLLISPPATADGTVIISLGDDTLVVSSFPPADVATPFYPLSIIFDDG